MAEFLHEDVSVAVRKSDDGEHYEAGLLLNGAFHRFAAFKAGGFDKRQNAAAEQAQAQASSTPGPVPPTSG